MLAAHVKAGFVDWPLDLRGALRYGSWLDGPSSFCFARTGSQSRRIPHADDIIGNTGVDISMGSGGTIFWGESLDAKRLV